MSSLDFSLRRTGPRHFQFKWKDVNRTLARRIIPITLIALRNAAPVSPSRPDAGRLRDSIGVRVEPTGPGSMQMRFVTTAPYAKYVIEGTNSETLITPSTEGVMALRWQAADGYHFASAVQRRPTRANPFNERVAMMMIPVYRQVFGDSLYLVAT
jgi:Bacteriophage HK97-gp10, putative tail-component